MESIKDIKQFLKNKGESEFLFTLDKITNSLANEPKLVGGYNPCAGNGDFTDLYIVVKFVKKFNINNRITSYKVAKVTRITKYKTKYILGKEYHYLEEAIDAANSCNINR